MKKTSLLSNTAVWLGASISAAEIMSGAMIASIGLRRGMLAILIGHLIGCLLFYLCGRIGADTGRSSMACVSLSFGEQGSCIFACMNAAQLVAWTVIMLHVSAQLLTTLSNGLLPVWAWCLIIGAGVLLWLFLSNVQIGYMNLIASALLLGLTFFMCYRSIQLGIDVAQERLFEQLSFGSAIEIAIALPMSWVPLVADYTSKAEKPRLTAAVSALVYMGGSIWMYSIGMAAAIACGHTDIIQLIVRMGFLRVPLIIVLLATMTTTFLEACSAGISAQTLSKKYTVRLLSMLLLVLAIVLSLFIGLDTYDSFLYIIASVFVPMSTILITDYFLLGHKTTDDAMDLGAMLLWAVGFVMYHLFMSLDLVIGCTLPLMLAIAIIRYVTERPWRSGDDE